MVIEEKRGEVAWNIVAEQTKFIGELLQDATKVYLKGNIKGWFEILTAVRENIDYDLKPNEKTDLNSLEKDCWSLQKYWNFHIKNIKDGKTVPSKVKEKKKEYVYSVRMYSRKLMEILNGLGYFPKKEDRTKLSF